MNNHGYDQQNKIIFGKFVGKTLEREYIQHEVSQAFKYIKPSFLILGFMYLLFLIPDLFLVKETDNLIFVFGNRIFAVISIALLYWKFVSVKQYDTLMAWITGCEMIVATTYLLIYFRYESPNFLIQAFGIMIIILSIFLLPNRWVNQVFVSLYIAVFFFILSKLMISPIESNHFFAAIVFVLLTIVLSSISSLIINYYKRIEFLKSKELSKLLVTDSLTGIYNRVQFNHEFARMITASSQGTMQVSIILFDFDHFKRINDEWGHLEGDKVMVKAVRLVETRLSGEDVFVRWGGEEFAVLLPNTGIVKAKELAWELCTAIENHSFNDNFKVTCSFGVTSYQSQDTIDTMMHRADELLYKAKQNGKNTVVSSF